MSFWYWLDLLAALRVGRPGHHALHEKRPAGSAGGHPPLRPAVHHGGGEPHGLLLRRPGPLRLHRHGHRGPVRPGRARGGGGGLCGGHRPALHPHPPEDPHGQRHGHQRLLLRGGGPGHLPEHPGGAELHQVQQPPHRRHPQRGPGGDRPAGSHPPGGGDPVGHLLQPHDALLRPPGPGGQPGHPGGVEELPLHRRHRRGGDHHHDLGGPFGDQRPAGPPRGGGPERGPEPAPVPPGLRGGGLVCGIGGLLVSYYLGTSTGASITLLLAVWFFVSLLFRKSR